MSLGLWMLVGGWEGAAGRALGFFLMVFVSGGWPWLIMSQSMLLGV